jgi:hypothetical protein
MRAAQPQAAESFGTDFLLCCLVASCVSVSHQRLRNCNKKRAPPAASGAVVADVAFEAGQQHIFAVYILIYISRFCSAFSY